MNDQNEKVAGGGRVNDQPVQIKAPDSEFLVILKPFLNTRPMFGVFALGDGSGWFCSHCGRRGDIGPNITHKEDCQERAHARAVAALKLALMDAGAE